MGRSKTRAEHVAAATWHPQALALRLQGMSYAEIGKTIGRDQAACYRAVSKHLETVRAQSAETAQELREVELQRLDRLLAVVGPMAESGDLQAVDRVLRIQERRAAYLGLDAPKAQLVAVDARPDTVRALMALVQPDANKRADDVIDVGDDSVR